MSIHSQVDEHILAAAGRIARDLTVELSHAETAVRELTARNATLERQLIDLRLVCDSQKAALDGKWISVDERLPEVKEFVSEMVLFAVEGKTYAGYLHSNGWFYEEPSTKHGTIMAKGRPDCVAGGFSGYMKDYPSATHWQPLPHAPKEA